MLSWRRHFGFAAAGWYNARMNFAVNWLQGWEDVIKLTIAYLLALPVGWYRDREAHSVGVRTDLEEIQVAD